MNSTTSIRRVVFANTKALHLSQGRYEGVVSIIKESPGLGRTQGWWLWADTPQWASPVMCGNFGEECLRVNSCCVCSSALMWGSLCEPGDGTLQTRYTCRLGHNTFALRCCNAPILQTALMLGLYFGAVFFFSFLKSEGFLKILVRSWGWLSTGFALV